MTKANKSTQPAGGVLAALQHASREELDAVDERIEELHSELASLRSAQKLLQIKFDCRPDKKPITRPESETARKIRTFIEKNGPGKVHAMVGATGLNAQAISACATKNNAFVKYDDGRIGLATANQNGDGVTCS